MTLRFAAMIVLLATGVAALAFTRAFGMFYFGAPPSDTVAATATANTIESPDSDVAPRAALSDHAASGDNT